MLMISPSHDKSIPLDKEGGMGRHLRSHKEMIRGLEWGLLTVSRIYLLLNLVDPIHSIYSFP